MGLVSDVFEDLRIIERLKGHSAIGHNRYSTTGSSHSVNIQPLLFNYKDDYIAIAHNGNFVNINSLRKVLQEKGTLFQTTTDTEIIVHLMAQSQERRLEDKIIDAFSRVSGAYSIVIMTKRKLIAVRDPHGFRPFCLGKINGSYIFTSESCALDLIGGEYMRDIEPGEVIVADKEGLRSLKLENYPRLSYCIFEFVYFSRPDSKIFGEFVDKTRRKLGKNLALEKPADADIVIAVPDSSNTAALGYSSRSNIKFEIGLIRNHYIGRTFINPSQSLRDLGVKIKFNPVGGVLKGRRVVVVEDSIVRGTTLQKLTKLLRKAGAKEVHVRVSSPPIKYPCFYGLDFPTREELIANKMSVPQIKEFLEVNSLEYLSIDGLLSSVSCGQENFCTACFSGDYPVPVTETADKSVFEALKLD